MQKLACTNGKFCRICTSIFLALVLLTVVFYLTWLNFGEASRLNVGRISTGMFSNTDYQVVMKGLRKTGNRKVVIGAVSCRDVTIKDTMKFNEETVTMMKSVMISAKLYNISEVEFHLFLELDEDAEYFFGKFQVGKPCKLTFFKLNFMMAY